MITQTEALTSEQEKEAFEERADKLQSNIPSAAITIATSLMIVIVGVGVGINTAALLGLVFIVGGSTSLIVSAFNLTKRLLAYQRLLAKAGQNHWL